MESDSQQNPEGFLNTSEFDIHVNNIEILIVVS